MALRRRLQTLLRVLSKLETSSALVIMELEIATSLKISHNSIGVWEGVPSGFTGCPGSGSEGRFIMVGDIGVEGGGVELVVPEVDGCGSSCLVS